MGLQPATSGVVPLPVPPFAAPQAGLACLSVSKSWHQGRLHIITVDIELQG